jgi:CBS domain containing-hemolysin-like protein
MAAELILALALVAANGFFVATEFAIARLRPTQVTEFVRQGRPGAKSTLHAVEHLDSYLSTCQLGELAPKSAAIARAGPMALMLAPPMRAFYLATKPLVDLFNWLGNHGPVKVVAWGRRPTRA